MTNHTRFRSLAVSVLLAFMIAALSAGAAAQHADNEDDLIRVITSIVDVVIPSAAQDFAELKSYKFASNLRDVPTWHTKLRLPKYWESEISDRGLSTELVLLFSSWPTKDGSWSKVSDRGAWLDYMYNAITAVLSRELKNGWKRKSARDREYGEADWGTGEMTRWTRKDGLVVLVERSEHWESEIYGSHIRNRDVRYILFVNLNIHVIKSK